MKNLFYLILALVLIGCKQSNQSMPIQHLQAETKTTIYEPKEDEIQLGNQIWMVENLNVDKFCNGEPIPRALTEEDWKQAGEDKKPAWCYYNNDSENGKKYGKMYNWYAVNDSRGLAPDGYRIPSRKELKLITDYLGKASGEAGRKMKSEEGWHNQCNGGTNISGFSGFPGGVRGADGNFAEIGQGGFWWTSSENSSNPTRAWTLMLLCSDDWSVLGPSIAKSEGMSIRCVRDSNHTENLCVPSQVPENQNSETSENDNNHQLGQKLNDLFFQIPFNSSIYDTRKIMFGDDNFFNQKPFNEMHRSLACDFKNNPLLSYIEYSRTNPALYVWFREGDEGKSYERKIVLTYYSKHLAKCELQVEDLVETFKKHTYRVESNKVYRAVTDKVTHIPTGEWDDRKGKEFKFYSSQENFQAGDYFLIVRYMEFYSGTVDESYMVDIICKEDNL